MTAISNSISSQASLAQGGGAAPAGGVNITA